MKSENQPFLTLFDPWAEEFWSVVHFLKKENEDFADDFLDVSQSLRRQYLRTRIFRQEWSSEVLPQRFFKLWRERLKSLSKRSGYGLEIGPEENDFISRSILYHLTVKKHKFKQIAEWHELPIQTVKRKAFESLIQWNQHRTQDLNPISRDCVRNDLFRLDYVYQELWNDPLGLYTRQMHEEHVRKCERCQKVNQKIQEAITQLAVVKLNHLQPDIHEQLRTELSSRIRVISLDSLSLWPWYLKTPIQMALVSLMFFAIVSIPYFGELFPGYRSSRTGVVDFTSRFTSSVVDRVRDVGIYVQDKWHQARHQESLPTEPVKVAQNEVSPEISNPPDPAPSLAPSPVTPPTPVTPAPTVVAKVEPLPLVTPKKKPAPPTEALDSEQDEAALRVFFRWGAFSRNLGEQTAAVMEIMKKYGAEKAGDLDLGAPYKGGSYFHFMVEESSLSDLISDIRKIGLIDFTQSSAKSDRTTPKGTKRVVFLLAPATSN